MNPRRGDEYAMNAKIFDLRFARFLRPLALGLASLALCASVAGADELKDARAALAGGQYDQAIRLFERVAAQGFAEGRAGVGQVYLRKRDYAKAKIPEYWIVDPETSTITQVRPAAVDYVARERLTWFPPGVPSALAFEVAAAFG